MIDLIRYITVCILIMLFLSRRSGAQDLVLPTGFPVYEISRGEEISPGYVFLSLNSAEDDTWLLIMDNHGTPVFYRYYSRVQTYFQLQPSAYLNFSMKLTPGSTTAIMDSSFNIINQVPIKNGYKNDRHDFLHTSQGEYILIGENPVTMDLSGIVEGGSSNATVEGAVIQIQNHAKEVVFEWNAMDHFNITDTYKDLTDSPIDNVHPNSVETDAEGNLLLISRSMNEITKISRTTGDIIWRLGGKNNQFTFADPTDEFSWPHSVSVLENGNITVFDNGNERVPSYSRAIEYKLDTINMTVTKIWEYDADKNYFARTKGSVQRLENGNTIIGYGGLSEPNVIEVNEDGAVTMQIDFTDGHASPIVQKHPWKTSLFAPDTDSIEFGEWDGSSHSSRSLTITNWSGDALELSNYHLQTDAFYFDAGVFPVTLSAGEERSLDLYYFPENIDSSLVSDILTINSDITTDTLVQRIAIQVHLRGTKTWSSIENRPSDRFRVYPNPLKDFLHIGSHHTLPARASIYSINGTLTDRIDLLEDQTIINLKTLEKGLYIIEIINSSSTPVYRVKIVKN